MVEEENRERVFAISELPSLTAINLPFLTDSATTALNALGISPAAQHPLRELSNSQLLLNISQSPLASPLIANPAAPTCALVLKLKRKRGATNEQAIISHVEAIGRIDQQIAFDSLADYQFLPSTHSSVIEAIPRPIAKLSVSITKLFQQKTKVNRKTQHTSSFQFIKFNDAVPSGPSPSSTSQKGS